MSESRTKPLLVAEAKRKGAVRLSALGSDVAPQPTDLPPMLETVLASLGHRIALREALEMESKRGGR